MSQWRRVLRVGVNMFVFRVRPWEDTWVVGEALSFSDTTETMMSVGLLFLVLVMVVVWVQATENPDIYLEVVSIILPRKALLNRTVM